MTQNLPQSWQFISEATLEEVVWQNLNALNLSPLSRQHYIQNQVCDILATDANRQLIIIELKNSEDRYLLPQLTRYYSAIVAEQPFQEHVDYTLPIRLVAIAPTFHAHNLIDRDYSRLDFELLTFSVVQTADVFELQLVYLGDSQTFSIPISSLFHPYLATVAGETAAPQPIIGPPPKSLRNLIDGLPLNQQTEVLAIRERILQFDPRMMEVGRTTSTQYGLKKGDTGIYKTKLCAEFIPIHPGSRHLRLMLLLPYPKREIGSQRMYKPTPVKGLAWAEVMRWVNDQPNVELFFYLGKTRNHHSYHSSLESYATLHHQLTECDRTFDNLEDLIDVALAEWMQQINP